MDQEQQNGQSAIEQLPNELIQLILGTLPDITSLKSAALSNPMIYQAFLEVETAITTQVLCTQIGLDVFPEAIIALESSRLRLYHDESESEPRKTILRFGSRYLQQRSIPSNTCLLLEALDLERLDNCVRDLAHMFATTVLAGCPVDQAEATSFATEQELCRIKRTLYIFEVYRNLFGPTSSQIEPAVVEHQKERFFTYFAPWEVEQLGCIHDFLVQLILPGFNDVAEHDVAWGASRVEYGDVVDSPFIQHILSLGLEKVQEIFRAGTYEDRYRLMSPGRYPRYCDTFLLKGLQNANEQNDDFFLNNSVLTDSDQVALPIKQPFFLDSDTGPEDIWRWAYQDESWACWIYQESRRKLRRWGYVMWDRQHLDGFGVFESAWEDAESSGDLVLEEHEAIRERAYMQNSWDKRELVQMTGGSGYWSWGDQSNVKHRNQAHLDYRAYDKAYDGPALVEPKSLQEAREALILMKLPNLSR